MPSSFKAVARTAIIKTFFRPEVVTTIFLQTCHSLPPQHKLLSEDEYHTQGVVETQRALEQLKDYCRSPESKPWSTVSRLQSPRRFAEFIEGSPHLTQAEVSREVQ